MTRSDSERSSRRPEVGLFREGRERKVLLEGEPISVGCAVGELVVRHEGDKNTAATRELSAKW